MKADQFYKIGSQIYERQDFWLQVKRTVNGVPVSEEEVCAIIKQIVMQLEVQNDDCLLDLGCGNAALSSRLFGMLNKYTGVDYSEYLVDIAREYFKPTESIRYVVNDIYTYTRDETNPEGYTKVLIYGVVSYLDKSEFIELMRMLYKRFSNVKRVFIGSIPDQSKAKDFFSARGIANYQLDNPGAALGVWWDKGEMVRSMREIGYVPLITHLEDSFYTSSYRFDLTLCPNQ